MYIRLQSFWASHKIHARDTLLLALPVIAGQLGQFLMGFIDTIMIGQISGEPLPDARLIGATLMEGSHTSAYLSAANLSNVFFIILTVVGMGVAFAISPLVAEAFSKGDKQRVGDYLKQGTWVGVGMSVIIAIGVYYSVELLPFMKQPHEDIDLAVSYTRILSLSVLPMMIFLVFKQFTDGLSLTVPAMIITIMGLVFNVGINSLLIFGRPEWGIPRLELDGAGWGTLASRTFMMVLMIGYVLTAKRFKELGLRRGWLRVQEKVMGKILAIGIPSGLQYFNEVAAFGGATIMIGMLDNGSVSRAAHTVAIQMAALSFMVVMGISAAASIRVGNALGQRNPLELRRAGTTGIIMAGLFMSFSAIIFLIGRDFFPSFFSRDEEILKIASQLMVIAAAFAIFDGIQSVGVGILRGMQDVQIPTIITAIVYWLVSLPVGAVLGFSADPNSEVSLPFGLGLGVHGMWWGFVMSLLLASILLTWRFWSLTGTMIAQAEAHQSTNEPSSIAPSEAVSQPVSS